MEKFSTFHFQFLLLHPMQALDIGDIIYGEILENQRKILEKLSDMDREVVSCEEF